jgi:hypothetical protein
MRSINIVCRDESDRLVAGRNRSASKENEVAQAAEDKDKAVDRKTLGATFKKGSTPSRGVSGLRTKVGKARRVGKS